MAAPQEWHKTIAGQSYVVTSSDGDLSHSFIQSAFDSNHMYWAKPLAPENLQKMLDNSLTFGLYTNSSPLSPKTQIGLARIITDHVTVAYVTDVYVDHAYQGKGLGKWLVRCVKEVVQEIPELRRVILLTGGGAGRGAQELYIKEMGMRVMGGLEGQMVAMSAKKADLLEVGGDSKGDGKE
jgi:GNAT superfamily N-acetyltransferase